MRASAVIALTLTLAATASPAQTVRNWFDDPFFPVTAGIAGCPEPAGPRVGEAERQAQSHRRAEKGTTCWLAKEPDCERANAFGYDRDIAEALRRAFAEDASFAGTSLWITVQGRIVYIEGCVAAPEQAGALEALAKRQPHVQQALAIVTDDPTARPPYRLFMR